MTQNPENPENWTDNRAIQDTLIKQPERADPESQIDRGASDDFADDRRDLAKSDAGEQANLTREVSDENQRDLTGEIAGEDPQWSE
jgi:hypothetical protein